MRFFDSPVVAFERVEHYRTDLPPVMRPEALTIQQKLALGFGEVSNGFLMPTGYDFEGLGYTYQSGEIVMSYRQFSPAGPVATYLAVDEWPGQAVSQVELALPYTIEYNPDPGSGGVPWSSAGYVGGFVLPAKFSYLAPGPEGRRYWSNNGNIRFAFLHDFRAYFKSFAFGEDFVIYGFTSPVSLVPIAMGSFEMMRYPNPTD